MPAVSARQRRFMGMEYAAAKRGEATRTGMSIGQLRDFARTPTRARRRSGRRGRRA